MPTDDDARIYYQECVVYICDTSGTFLGTGFRFKRSGLILTARHVVGDHASVIIGCVRHTTNQNTSVQSKQIITHANSDFDIVAIITDDTDLQHFTLASQSNAVLGAHIECYGYPLMPARNDESSPTFHEIQPRLLQGHIQRIFSHSHRDENNQFSYTAFEVGYPAFGGQSGSPVCLAPELFNTEGRLHVLALTTSTTTYREIQTQVSWATALALHPVSDWLDSL